MAEHELTVGAWTFCHPLVGRRGCYATPNGRFAALHRRTGQRVVVLVDEYDKPILDALETPHIARANRNFLRGLYSVVKDSDPTSGSRSLPA